MLLCYDNSVYKCFLCCSEFAKCPIPTGWTVSTTNSKKAFNLFTVPSTFVGAVNMCNKYGGRLATAGNDAELVQLNSMSKFENGEIRDSFHER